MNLKVENRTFWSTVSCRNLFEEEIIGNLAYTVSDNISAMHRVYNSYRENHYHQGLWRWSEQLQAFHEASLPLKLKFGHTSQIWYEQNYLTQDLLSYAVLKLK